MKIKLSFLLFLCPVFWVNAQEITITKSAAIQIGEKVPDVLLPKILNNHVRSLRLSDFHGKLLILDFWATSCGSCIQAMPRLDSLQQLFGDKIVILPVTAEKAEHVAHFQHTNGFLNGLPFRTVVEDRALHAFFPHRLLPHEVWIDGDGKVLGFTEVEAVTASMIERVLAGKGLNAPIKADALDYDSDKPLLVNNNGGPDTTYRYRSVITGKLNGLPSAISISYDSLKKLTVIRATNVSVRRLYTIAFKGLRSLPDDLVILGPDRGVFCYELALPGNSAATLRQSVREDLDRFFSVRSEFTGTAFRLVPLSDDNIHEPLSL